ncbi:MAG: hypothetical protein LC777_16045 [Actinobacteria bacterium]|nr:hypothetical protein [Actinomycetota bacterium]
MLDVERWAELGREHFVRRVDQGARPAHRPGAQVLWIERFATHEELRARVRAFASTYNRKWLVERHGFLTPLEARERLLRQVAVG